MEKQLLKRLFESLNNSEYNYCVLRNYESLPESTGGSDLDIAVLPEEEDSVCRLVHEVVRKFGGEVIIEYRASARVLRCLGCVDEKWWGLAVDLFSSIEYRGVEYIASKSVIKRSLYYKGIKVAEDCDANTIALAKELLSNGKTRKDHLTKAVDYYSQKGKSALTILQKSFSPGTIDNIRDVLSVGSEDNDKVNHLVRMLRRDVLGPGWLAKIPSRIKNGMSRYRRLFRPPGVCLAVLGTDGAGKTTMIDAISPVLEQALHHKIQYEHMRPNWLPDLGVSMRQRAASDNKIVTSPHAQNPSGLIGSLIRLAYYAVDYHIGYWINIFPALVKRPHICLFDRYYYDFLIDPKRMRIKLPQKIMRIAFLFAPQPSIILCLGGNPEVIYARKPETSLIEVTRQIQELKSLCQSNPRAIWIDTDVGFEDSKHQMLSAIKSAFEKIKK
jgi:thymidylate kinase